MKKRYIKKFEQFVVNENDDSVENGRSMETNDSESKENILSDPPKELITKKEPIVDESEEKGLTNKANLDS